MHHLRRNPCFFPYYISLFSFRSSLYTTLFFDNGRKTSSIVSSRETTFSPPQSSSWFPAMKSCFRYCAHQIKYCSSAQLSTLQSPSHLYAVCVVGGVRQVSAVQKLARVMHLTPGVRLYRGLGGNVRLPRSFYKTDAHGCWGFTEWAFMSTTSELKVHPFSFAFRVLKIVRQTSNGMLSSARNCSATYLDCSNMILRYWYEQLEAFLRLCAVNSQALRFFGIKVLSWEFDPLINIFKYHRYLRVRYLYWVWRYLYRVWYSYLCIDIYIESDAI